MTSRSGKGELVSCVAVTQILLHCTTECVLGPDDSWRTRKPRRLGCDSPPPKQERQRRERQGVVTLMQQQKSPPNVKPSTKTHKKNKETLHQMDKKLVTLVTGALTPPPEDRSKRVKKLQPWPAAEGKQTEAI